MSKTDWSQIIHKILIALPRDTPFVTRSQIEKDMKLMAFKNHSKVAGNACNLKKKAGQLNLQWYWNFSVQMFFVQTLQILTGTPRDFKSRLVAKLEKYYTPSSAGNLILICLGIKISFRYSQNHHLSTTTNKNLYTALAQTYMLATVICNLTLLSISLGDEVEEDSTLCTYEQSDPFDLIATS